MLVDGKEELMLVSKQGIGIRIKCSDISIIGRATQGVRVMRLESGDHLAAAAKNSTEQRKKHPQSSRNEILCFSQPRFGKYLSGRN